MIKVAVVQMNVSPAPTPERLSRAEAIAVAAARQGAQLVVLPELFNTGYVYDDSNFAHAEPVDGLTATWMQTTAARLNMHLAGSMLLREGGEIYNAMRLFAPDRRGWRYDKNYPWGWERGYFRGRRAVTVVETDLGAFGMMLCWDTGHLDLWRSYAGRVDMILVSSCPPDFSNPVHIFPNGDRLKLEDLGATAGKIKNAGELVFGEMFAQQTAWLGVPAANAMACGHFQSGIPNGRGYVLGMLALAPRLARYLFQAEGLQLACDMVEGTKVLDGRGQVLVARTQSQGEGFAITGITLPDERPQPRDPQPRSPVPGLVYFGSDFMFPWLARSTYGRR